MSDNKKGDSPLTAAGVDEEAHDKSGDKAKQRKKKREKKKKGKGDQ